MFLNKRNTFAWIPLGCFVNGHSLTICDIVCLPPYAQNGSSRMPQSYRVAAQRPWPVRYRLRNEDSPITSVKIKTGLADGWIRYQELVGWIAWWWLIMMSVRPLHGSNIQGLAWPSCWFLGPARPVGHQNLLDPARLGPPTFRLGPALLFNELRMTSDWMKQ